jgi:peroxiredoxin Q/BCP
MLKEGTKAPDFTLDSEAGKVELTDSKGHWVVVYFYPKDSTPGCTREAQAFTALSKKFEKVDAVVLGISKDSVKSHLSFTEKYKLKVTLLSDPDLAVHKAYGAYGEKVMYGKKVLGVIRSTFVVAPDGKVARAFKGVKVDGHAEKVLETIMDLQGGVTKKPSKKGASAET